MRVQALLSEFAIERLYEGVVRWLPGPGEIQDDPALIGPEIEISRDEFGSLIHPDHLRIPGVGASFIQRPNHVFSVLTQ